MHFRGPAIVLSARPHGETAIIARALTEAHGVIAAYVAGGRGRRMRPIAISGNRVEFDVSARAETQLPFARLELIESRGPWLSEALPAAAIAWSCALTASALPERQPYPALYAALGGLLDAVCHAPSARGWVPALASYERLMLRELGYGRGAVMPPIDLDAALAALDGLAEPIERYLLADRRGDVMAARARLRDLLSRI